MKKNLIQNTINNFSNMINNQLKNAIDKWSNSFLRPLIPPKLLSNSEIKGTEDDGAKLIYLKFLYGIKEKR